MPMIMLNRKLLVILIVILAVAGIIAANYVFKNDEMPSQQSQTQNPDSNAVAGESPAEEPSPFANKPINEVPRYTGRPLDEIVFGKGFSAPEAAIEKRRGDLKVLAAVLTANPMGSGGVDDWIAVGVIKKFFNDYEGTRDAWEYAGVLYPNNALSFANLGNLYAFYLNDPAKAEFNFRKAISNDPYQPGYYLNLADFYRTAYVAKKSEAPKILLEGMSVIKDVNLVLALASYYRDNGDKTNALKYYQEVLKLSPNQLGIAEEIDRLK